MANSLSALPFLCSLLVTDGDRQDTHALAFARAGTSRNTPYVATVALAPPRQALIALNPELYDEVQRLWLVGAMIVVAPPSGEGPLEGYAAATLDPRTRHFQLSASITEPAGRANIFLTLSCRKP